MKANLFANATKSFKLKPKSSASLSLLNVNYYLTIKVCKIFIEIVKTRNLEISLDKMLMFRWRQAECVLAEVGRGLLHHQGVVF